MKPPNKISSTIPKTLNKTNSTSSLETKLKATDPEIQHYVTALTSENAKLVRKYTKCEAEKVTLKNRIIILEHDLEEEKQKPKITEYIENLKKRRLK